MLGLAILLIPAEALAVPSYSIPDETYQAMLPGGKEADFARSVADAMEQARLDGTLGPWMERGGNPCESWAYYIYYPNSCDPSTNLPYSP